MNKGPKLKFNDMIRYLFNSVMSQMSIAIIIKQIYAKIALNQFKNDFFAEVNYGR